MRKLFSVVLAVALGACGSSDKDDRSNEICQGYPAANCDVCSLTDDSIDTRMIPYNEEGEDNWVEDDWDLVCSAPTPTGETCTFYGAVIDFEEDEFLESGILAGTKVRVYPDNIVVDTACDSPGTDGATCWEATANEQGFVDFPGLECDKPFAIWAFKESTIVPVTKAAIEYNRVTDKAPDATTPSRADVITISVKTFNLIPGIVGFATDPTLGIVAGKARDCADRGVANVTTHIFEKGDAPAAYCGEGSMYRVGNFYFRNNFPTAEQTITSQDGLWAFANVPVGDVTVHAYGRDADAGELVHKGQTDAISLADTITIVDVYVVDRD